MSRLVRGKHGKFVAKSSESREVRSLRLTDKTWKVLGDAADAQGVTRADLIEQIADSMSSEQPAVTGDVSLQQIEEVITQILNDPQVTRHGKDRGSVRRALESLLSRLS